MGQAAVQEYGRGSRVSLTAPCRPGMWVSLAPRELRALAPKSREVPKTMRVRTGTRLVLQHMTTRAGAAWTGARRSQQSGVGLSSLGQQLALKQVRYQNAFLSIMCKIFFRLRSSSSFGVLRFSLNHSCVGDQITNVHLYEEESASHVVKCTCYYRCGVRDVTSKRSNTFI